MGSFLVSHPHVATVSKGTAAALQNEGLLAQFITGTAAAHGSVSEALLRAVGKIRPVSLNRIVPGVDASNLRSLAPVETLARVVAGLSGHVGRPISAYDAMYVSHDAVVSWMPWPAGLSSVYAYEDAALRTFRCAARKGLKRVYDLPIPHYLTLERMWVEEARRWPGAMGSSPRLEPAWKRARKDGELELATHVYAPSNYTRRSLEAVDVRVPIFVTPFGFPVEDFPPKAEPPSGPFTVVAVGSHNLRKGTPYLLEAWRAAGLKDARLVLVGPLGLRRQFLDQYAGLFEHVPHVARTNLAAVYAAADLLALPTLGDGCPLVVQEAMSCATPVVTTPCGSGTDVVDDALNGWVIPERNVDALVNCFREAASDRDRTVGMGLAARRRAESWTWKEAGALIARNLATV